MRKIFFILFALCVMFSMGCSKNPSQMQLESLQALETTMRMNVEDPEALLKAMDAYIEKYTPVWKAVSDANEVRSAESLVREANLQSEAIRDVTQEIVDLDLEIQDRLANDPKMLRAYLDRVRQIGYRAE